MRSSTTRLALIGAALAVVAGPALAAEIRTPVVCGSGGCTSLSTATLQGILTLPDALRPAGTPRARPFFLFRAQGPDGAMREVVYVPREADALLGFGGGAGWRLVPADDAKLLADAAASTKPYRAPDAGMSLGGLFAAGERSDSGDAAWAAAAALLGVVALGAAVYSIVRRSRHGG